VGAAAAAKGQVAHPQPLGAARVDPPPSFVLSWEEPSYASACFGEKGRTP
jgi:hypothetical protein